MVVYLLPVVKVGVFWADEALFWDIDDASSQFFGSSEGLGLFFWVVGSGERHNSVDLLNPSLFWEIVG